MSAFKDEVKPLIDKMLKKGYRWVSQFVSAADYALSNASLVLREKKKEWHDYLADRKILVDKIHKRQEEVDRLRVQMEEANEGQTSRLLRLHEKLEKRTAELVYHQQQYTELQKAIDASRHQAEEVSKEKELAVHERNWLKSEYDYFQGFIRENLAKQDSLNQELEQLKKGQTQTAHVEGPSFQQKMQEIEKEMEGLQQAKLEHEKKLSRLEKRLIEKVSRVAELSGQLQSAKLELKNKDKEAKELHQSIERRGKEIKKSRTESESLKKEMADLRKSKSYYSRQYVAASKELSQWTEALRKQEDIHWQDLVHSEEEISRLQEELLSAQNHLAVEQASGGSPVELSPAALEVLEQEYEPRFKTLYRECYFHPEFFHDFFMLVPSDRLKVEACIVNLNFYFELHIGKVRPHTVKTSSGALNEYPFGRDHTGRIYFKRDQRKVQFYRISRTKNGKGPLDQTKVIAWLKKNR